MADNFVDFRIIKEQVSMEAVLDRYKTKLRRVTETSLRGKCPLPTHTSAKSTESFSVHTGKNMWSCQSNSCARARQGKKGGNVLDFVAVMENCSIRDAGLKLREWFPMISPPVPARPMETGMQKREQLVAEEGNVSDAQANKPLAFTLKGIDPSHPYLRRRGISPETAQQFGVGFFPGRGSMSGRVVIPIHDDRGQLVAYAGRSIDGTEPKYRFPTGFLKSAVLFNLHRVLALPHEQGSDLVIVVEGFFDCMKVHQAGCENVVALMGSSLSETQEELLGRFTRVILFLDGDEPGKGAARQIASRLVESHFVKVISPLDGMQPDQLSSPEIQRLLSQCRA